MLALLFSLFLLFPYSQSDFMADLRKTIKFYRCAPECIFKHAEVTSKTIGFFPECEEICGILNFNSNLDLSEEQLKVAFKKMHVLNGGVRIENTKLKNLNFFTVNKEQQLFGLDCYTGCAEHSCQVLLGGLTLVNTTAASPSLASIRETRGDILIQDTNLQNLSFMKNWEILKISDDGYTNHIAINIKNNYEMTRLGISSVKHIITRSQLYVVVHDNHPKLVRDNYLSLFDAFFTLVEFYGGGWGGLRLVNTSVSAEINNLSNVKTIIGGIEISYTNLDNLEFLRSVKEVKFEDIMDKTGINVNIHHNPEMKYLGLKAVKKLTTYNTFTMNLESLHPDFCISIPEMVVFLNSFVIFRYLDAKLCDISQSDTPKTCQFHELSSLESDCVYIIGDLLIDSGDEGYVEKLKNLTVIFGSLTIQNTNLVDFKFLGKLRKIANLNDQIPVIQLINNRNLKTIEHLKIKLMRNRTIVCPFDRKVTVVGNRADLLPKNYAVLEIMENVSTWENSQKSGVVDNKHGPTSSSVEDLDVTGGEVPAVPEEGTGVSNQETAVLDEEASSMPVDVPALPEEAPAMPEAVPEANTDEAPANTDGLDRTVRNQVPALPVEARALPADVPVTRTDDAPSMREEAQSLPEDAPDLPVEVPAPALPEETSAPSNRVPAHEAQTSTSEETLVSHSDGVPLNENLAAGTTTVLNQVPALPEETPAPSEDVPVASTDTAPSHTVGVDRAVRNPTEVESLEFPVGTESEYSDEGSDDEESSDSDADAELLEIAITLSILDMNKTNQINN
ncbi:hypothetical protein GCK72_004176 [Caenorhabditis remanei]|uniref:Receptor L-domain domain-containing protein n=1 Tax=Caenorhabditis remanei TaxID=31234 RepID=A0A6A5HAY7_CAERE|nr:hypothetical protein GCK72_004176 [Caenorhabditis remanei]KAF1764229.1 hypothetical protein GCK72_004176 [Caenorhabditis remanei]